MPFNIRWRLTYPTGAAITEDAEGSTILHRWKHPAVFEVLQGETPVWNVKLTPDQYPIFYRNRALGMDGVSQPTTDAVVFGVAGLGADTVDCKLWHWANGEVRDCPPDLIRQETLEFLVQYAPETAAMV